MRKKCLSMFTTIILSAIMFSGCDNDTDPVPPVKVKNDNKDRIPVIVDDDIVP